MPLEAVAQCLDDAGVDTTYVNTVEGASGVALITTGLHGENNIVVVPGANGHLTRHFWKKRRRFWNAQDFFCQLEIPLETVDYLAQFAERTTFRSCSIRRRRASFPQPCFAGCHGLRKRN